MKIAGRLAWTASVAIIALVALLAIPKLSTTRAIAIWVVVATGLVLLAIIRHSRERGGPEPPAKQEQCPRCLTAAGEHVSYRRVFARG